MLRKIFKTGHSSAVTLPQPFLKEMGLKSGDEVRLETDKEKELIIISHGKKESQLTMGFKIRPKLK